MAELLEDVPLHVKRKIPLSFEAATKGPNEIKAPTAIRVHCNHQHCNGERRHERISQNTLWIDASTESDAAVIYVSVFYRCSNCEKNTKEFILRIELGLDFNQKENTCVKIYENPPFGQPIPKRLFHIIGEENRQHFLQARRAIARGLGVGAHA